MFASGLAALRAGCSALSLIAWPSDIRRNQVVSLQPIIKSLRARVAVVTVIPLTPDGDG
jgi:hypothetical protein